MKFGTGSTTELIQKREGQSTKMPYVRPNIYINKQTSPIFNCVTPVSVARQITCYTVITDASINVCRSVFLLMSMLRNKMEANNN